MTAEENAKCLISVELARHIANHFNCLTDEDNANIDKVATLLASQIAVDKVINEADAADQPKMADTQGDPK